MSHMRKLGKKMCPTLRTLEIVTRYLTENSEKYCTHRDAQRLAAKLIGCVSVTENLKRNPQLWATKAVEEFHKSFRNQHSKPVSG